MGRFVTICRTTDEHLFSIVNHWQVNPNYESTYVFQNDFPALLEDTPSPPQSDDPLFQISDAKGTCRVMCFHPKLNRTLPIMSPEEIQIVIDEYALFIFCLQIYIFWTISYLVDG